MLLFYSVVFQTGTSKATTNIRFLIIFFHFFFTFKFFFSFCAVKMVTYGGCGKESVSYSQSKANKWIHHTIFCLFNTAVIQAILGVPQNLEMFGQIGQFGQPFRNNGSLKEFFDRTFLDHNPIGFFWKKLDNSSKFFRKMWTYLENLNKFGQTLKKLDN